MARFSTGLRNALAGNYGLGIMMNGGLIRVYSGSIPATPDGAPTGTHLGTITTDGLNFVFPGDPFGAGLMLTVLSPGILANDGNWRLKGVASGTAGWWRWCWRESDPLTLSTFYPRVDGVMGTELVLQSTFITPSTNVQIESFSIQLGLGN
jgi:hypothetical protein